MKRNKETQSNQMQSRKQYWQTIEERNSPDVPFWQTPEFPTSIDEMKKEARKKGVSRKNFIKLMGASTVMATAACRRPTEQIVPAVIQPNEIVPGNFLFYSTTAPDGSGLIIRAREGRPIKIAGNPEHPLTKGGVSSWTISSIMDLYDPDRQKKAAKIVNGRAKRAKEEDIASELQSAIGEGSYVLLTGPIESPSSRALINDFISKNPGGRHVQYRQDPTLRQIAEGQKATYGSAILPNFRFDRAELVVSIEGDFMGSMPGSTYFNANYSEKRSVAKNKDINRLVVFESMFTLTGSNADNRTPIRPGDAAAIALALASEITVNQGNGSMASNGTVRSMLEKYTPEKVAEFTGVDGEAIRSVASELWKKRGKSLVLGGSPLAANGNDLSLQVAINLLNSILGNDGKTVDYQHPMNLEPGASDKEIQSLVESMRAGEIKTLIVAGANPVYHFPSELQVEEALKNVENVYSLSDRIDETGKLAKAILPSSHYLESWGDSELVSGIYSVRQPVIRPLYETRSLEDRLIQLNGGTINGQETFHSYVKARWMRLGSGGEEFWTSVLQTGYHAAGLSALKSTSGSRGFNAASLNGVTKVRQKQGTMLGLYYSTQILDGTGANNAYRQEMPEPLTKVVWQNSIIMLPKTARKLGIKQGNVVQVTTEKGSFWLPVFLLPGIHPDAILVALGYGRTAAGRVGSEIGKDMKDFVSIGSRSFAYSGLSVRAMSKTGERHKIASTQSIFRYDHNHEQKAPFAPAGMPAAPLGPSSQYDRPLILETTLKDYKKDPHTFHPEKIHYPTEDYKLMKEWKYDGMRWHMVVDLNQCIGCTACVTSCNLENNIPMVGPDEVYTGREMHWLRIDRYFSGSEENPEVAHQPMTCQHCENAPCENVCPVAATQHNSEGLNVMAYNRCIGTRYCANNCPYKVRRFNWFENWNKMEGLWRRVKTPQNLAFNPQVAVRSRGVIEKCSFCIHRIQSARNEYQASDMDTIPDGVVVPACQEVCPTGAITFGNINDQESKVFQIVKEEENRGYKVLDFLDTKPSITYLAKIRNKDKEYASAGKHHAPEHKKDGHETEKHGDGHGHG